MKKPTIEEMIRRSIAKNQDPPMVRFIEYNDMGKGTESVIILHSRNGEGRLMRLLANGKLTNDMCPCCMEFQTNMNIMRIIKDSHVKKVVWVSTHASAVQDYFPELRNGVKLSETEYAYDCSV